MAINNINKLLPVILFLNISCMQEKADSPISLLNGSVNLNRISEMDSIDKNITIIENDKNEFNYLQGIWNIKNKFDATNKEKKFNVTTKLNINGKVITKIVDNKIIFIDTLLELHNFENSRFEIIIKGHEKLGVYFSKSKIDELHLSYLKYDGGYDLFQRH